MAPPPIEEEPAAEDESFGSDGSSLRPPKRARAMSIDSDDLDADAPSAPISSSATPAERSRGVSTAATAVNVLPSALRPVGSFMNCGECGKRFTVVSALGEALRPALHVADIPDSVHEGAPYPQEDIPLCPMLPQARRRRLRKEEAD